jgi:hypothetical protein
MKNLVSILLVLQLFGCTSSQFDLVKEDLTVIDVKPNFDGNMDFLGDTTFIPLEFCEDCIIGNITKVLKTENGFIISDKSLAKQIFKFDNQGKFEFRIGTQGDGLGNYVLPFDISLIPSTNKLAVLDQNQSKILFFDLKNGDFIEEIRINFQAKSFFFIDSVTIALHLDGNFSGLEKDRLGGILDLTNNEYTFKGVNDFTKTDQNLTGGDFYEAGGRVLFTKSLNDTVYSVSNYGFFPKYFFDFGEKSVSEEVKKKPGMEMLEEMMKTVPYYHNGNVIENEKFLFYLWWADDLTEKFSWYNKSTNKNFSISGEKVIFKRPFFINEEYMLSFMTNVDFEQMNIESNFGRSENQTLIKINFK